MTMDSSSSGGTPDSGSSSGSSSGGQGDAGNSDAGNGGICTRASTNACPDTQTCCGANCCTSGQLCCPTSHLVATPAGGTILPIITYVCETTDSGTCPPYVCGTSSSGVIVCPVTP